MQANIDHEEGLESADLVLLNAKVITVDDSFSIQEALAVKNGKIIFVGKTAAVDRYADSHTERIDLQGRVVLPGINDTHAHVDSIGLFMPPIALDLNHPSVASIAEIVAVVAAKAADTPAGAWIRGNGYNPDFLAECQADPGRQPSRRDLDPVSAGHPAMLWDFSHHNLWANSRALELAGITRNTADPVGGTIVRDQSGEPTGILREAAAGPVEAIAPPLTKEEKKAALLTGIREMNRYGITSYTQPQLAPGGDLVPIYQDLFASGQLTARVTGMILFGSNFEELKQNLDKWQAPQGLDERWLRFSQIKIMADGIPQTGTAWMVDPYVGGGIGSLTINAATDLEKYENLQQMIEYGHARGWQIGIHGTGDRAIAAILDGYESAQRLYPQISARRHYIIHDELIGPADIERSARLGVAAAMQPFLHKVTADNAAAVLGAKRARWDWPFNSVLKAGVKLTFSSDTPVIPPDWRRGVQAAVLRQGFSGNVSGPEQRIGREDAIRAYTINGAWQDHMEREKGSIEQGKAADLCVLDGNILSVPAEEITTIPVHLTIAGGRIVYRNQGA